MITLIALKARALQAGFDRCYALAPAKAPRPAVNRYNAGVCDDARELMPSVQSVIVLLMGYKPYENHLDRPYLSGYYPVSNRAYHAAKEVAEYIEAEGWRAIPNAEIAIKPYLLASGVGENGYNSLVSVEGLGTRFHAQVILTDAPLEFSETSGSGGMSRLCADCQRCVRACPTGAISTGRVNANRCLRSRDGGEIADDDMREKYGNCLLGCEICQSVCPRNRGADEIPMEEALGKALELQSLLLGNVRPLVPFLGRNYARRSRIRMKAALVAANLGRYDLLPELKRMRDEGTEGERAHAEWAIERLEEAYKRAIINSKEDEP